MVKLLLNKKYVLQDKPYQIVLDADRKTITANGEDISLTVSVVDKMEFFALQRQTNSGYQGGYRAACNSDATSLEMFHKDTMKLLAEVGSPRNYYNCG
jgi:beta-galactosidase